MINHWIYVYEQNHQVNLVKNKKIIVPPTGRWKRLNGIRTFSMQFTEERLSEMHGPLFGLAAEFAKEHPDVEMLQAGKSSRRLTKDALSKGDHVVMKKSSSRPRGERSS